jgi:hypothetical protein
MAARKMNRIYRTSKYQCLPARRAAAAEPQMPTNDADAAADTLKQEDRRPNDAN